jgi:hypothetical protein
MTNAETAMNNAFMKEAAMSGAAMNGAAMNGSVSNETALSPSDARRYVIRIREKLDHHWSARFGGLALRHEEEGTVLAGKLPSTEALHGVLAAFNSLGLSLVSVHEEVA